ncbi:PAS domain S-box-containing protein/diguanylate cyclase (GGDEF)-like protein [Solirubrobacter pauli]|uniref:PAS domain S-box-containing protein/diguanylate cyclase (GGDEF)-like protein n=1 Tax=Solirubrobacter pauli TaxID=166793 RepID=A0A660LDB7_9ACTN|nr:EAL domain-containing protein [Solirubrobacter pauli]RKQ93058.1 PAS domain S-box-containing protein/diguanylate cyclase (GGDEF)-like protein [Solirubrobacter pauli]
MPVAEALRILLVEDDEDDFVLTRSMLGAQGQTRVVELDWEQRFETALRAIREARHDLYLVDFRLGERTGLQLVREAWERNPPAPVILLTGQDDYEVDLQATELGVTDYLVKGTLDALSLERTIRYALRQHQTTLDLRRSEERYAVAVRATNDGIWDWDLQTARMHYSERWKTLLGYDQFASHRPDAWFELVHPDDVERLRHEIDHHLAGASPHFESEHRIRHADGSWRWVLTRGLATRNGGAPVRITGSLSDVTERHNAQQRLIHEALHDSLTGLPNRTLFLNRLEHCLRQHARQPSLGCAVLYVDLDRFKLVNDSLSHATGDRLLVALARRIEQVVRPGDTVGRLGGDEFTILLEEISRPEQAAEVAGRVGDAMAVPIDVDGRMLSISASIGIAHTFDAEADGHELMRNADIAMYDAKAQGGGRARTFDASMHRRVLERLSLEAQLREAIVEGRLRTFFQPIVDLRTGELNGLEALARWPEDDRSVSPAEFIPVAEDSGLIAPLGELMLRNACETLSRWRTRGAVAPGVTVSVNVSLRQITEGNLVEKVRAALGDAGLPAANLVLEITESTLMENPELVSAVLRELLAIGVSLHLDDFGTGYSSLTVLHNFPGGTLKIDRAFVADMITRPESHTIVRSIVGLAHNLGLCLIAEGIEGPEQVAALAALECELGQGYHFARPQSADDLEAGYLVPRPVLRG